MNEPFSILHVCVGNICRSVMAERLTTWEAQRRLGPRANLVRVTSAGTRARPGEHMHPYAAAALRTFGADPDGSAARRLTPELIAAGDVILTATVTERDDVLSMVPAALNRTFTLREFARLSAHLPPPAPASPIPPGAVVAAVLGQRWRMPVGEHDSDDIADPRRTRSGLMACAVVIADAVRATMSALLTADGTVRTG